MTKYVYHAISVLDENQKHIEERFFIGRLPEKGEAVEMVFIGRDPDTGDMQFQLRVKGAAANNALNQQIASGDWASAAREAADRKPDAFVDAMRNKYKR